MSTIVALALRSRCKAITAARSTVVSTSPLKTTTDSRSDSPAYRTAPAVPSGAELWLNSGALLAGAIIARLSRASAILICARLLRPERFGEVVAALAAYEMLRVIGEAGLDTRLIRHVAREPTQTRNLTATTISLKIKIYTFLIASGLAVAILRISSADWHVFASIAIGTFGIAVTGSAQAVVTASDSRERCRR